MWATAVLLATALRAADDLDFWSPIEVFVREHSDAEFSQSLCPDCIHRLYPEISDAPSLNVPKRPESRIFAGPYGGEKAGGRVEKVGDFEHLLFRAAP
jgi:hypothetical protein